MFKRTATTMVILATLCFWALWMGTVVFWIRSYWIQDVAAIETEKPMAAVQFVMPYETSRRYLAISSQGGISLAIHRVNRAATVQPIESMWQSMPAQWYPQPWGGWSLPQAKLAVKYDAELTMTRQTPAPTNTAARAPATFPSSPNIPLYSQRRSQAATTNVSPPASNGKGAMSNTTYGTFDFGTIPEFKVTSEKPSETVYYGGRSIGGGTLGGIGSGMSTRTGGGTNTIRTAGRLQSALTLPAPPTLPPADFKFVAYQVGGGPDQARWTGVLVFPFWFGQLWFLIPALIGSIASWKMIRSHRRVAQGCCAGCGYDLRESPQKCPECGMAAVDVL